MGSKQIPKSLRLTSKSSNLVSVFSHMRLNHYGSVIVVLPGLLTWMKILDGEADFSSVHQLSTDCPPAPCADQLHIALQAMHLLSQAQSERHLAVCHHSVLWHDANLNNFGISTATEYTRSFHPQKLLSMVHASPQIAYDQYDFWKTTITINKHGNL